MTNSTVSSASVFEANTSQWKRASVGSPDKASAVQVRENLRDLPALEDFEHLENLEYIPEDLQGFQ